MNVTKNQHYVSQGILKHFADDKKKIYEMYIEKKIISKKSIVSTMSQNYIYEHPRIQTNTLEHMFSYAEGMMIPTLDKIVANIEQDYCTEKKCINRFDEIKEILPFVLMFYFRSGALLHEYEFSSIMKTRTCVKI